MSIMAPLEIDVYTAIKYSFWLKTNSRIYNLISVPQITQRLLADAIMSSKTVVVVVLARRRNIVVARRRNEATVKLETIQQCQQSCHLFEFFKQQSNILWCFCSLKFERNYLAVSFSVLYITVR